MHKKYKLKKEFRYALIGIVIILIGIFVGRSIYKDYVYKNLYEYKLVNHVFKDDVVKLLIK